MTVPPHAYIGTSGWTYAHWRGAFYPSGLPQRAQLEYLARQLNSVEINATFYSLQRPSSFHRWSSLAPAHFRFAVKGARFITHVQRLREVEAPLANFFASGVLALGDKLGPILWQLPQGLRFDPTLLDNFLSRLPRTHQAAADLARHHDPRLQGRAFTDACHQGRLSYALEVRNASFLNPACVELLRAHGVALVVSDGAGRWPMAFDVTADFVYLRLHGSTQLYSSNYTDQELDAWAKRLAAWQAGATPDDARLVAAPPAPQPRDAYVYFDNDAQAYAAFNALALAQRIGRSPR